MKLVPTHQGKIGGGAAVHIGHLPQELIAQPPAVVLLFLARRRLLLLVRTVQSKWRAKVSWPALG